MLTNAERDLIMTRLTGAGGTWDPAALYVGVIESIVGTGPGVVIGDITEPLGTGFARQACTPLQTSHVKSDGRAQRDGPLLWYRPADYTEATTIIGFFVATALTGGVLVDYEMLPEPVSLADETHALGVTAALCVSPLASSFQWDSYTVING